MLDISFSDIIFTLIDGESKLIIHIIILVIILVLYASFLWLKEYNSRKARFVRAFSRALDESDGGDSNNMILLINSVMDDIHLFNLGLQMFIDRFLKEEWMKRGHGDVMKMSDSIGHVD